MSTLTVVSYGLRKHARKKIDAFARMLSEANLIFPVRSEVSVTVEHLPYERGKKLVVSLETNLENKTPMEMFAAYVAQAVCMNLRLADLCSGLIKSFLLKVQAGDRSFSGKYIRSPNDFVTSS